MELPAHFAAYTRSLLGEEEYDRLLVALQEEQPISIRLNEDKLQDTSFSLFRTFAVRVPWASSGFYLSKRPTFTFDPLFHAGCYYVQEAASMFVEQALRRYAADKPVVMLDLCAAPGGKSTHALSTLPDGSLLVANEVIRSRSQILAENLTKWGHAEVVVTNNDPADFASLNAFFDVILTDVPCSGEGMFRKDPVALKEWSPENVEICWQRQRRIVSDIWPCLKPGGLLIYSTCTYNTKEDEENVRWMGDTFGAEVLALEVPDEWHVTSNLLSGEDFPVYRFLPHKTRGEGFFLAVLRKPESEVRVEVAGQVSLQEKAVTLCGKRSGNRRENGQKSRRGIATSAFSKEQLSVMSQWLSVPEGYEFRSEGTHISAFPHALLPELSVLRSSLRVVQAGIAIAELKGRDLLPAQALAMSLALNADAFAREELTYEQAIRFLRKETLVLPDTAPRGVVLLTYKQIPLGFVKNIGNRANNLYPSEWRIRSGYLPEEISELPIEC